MKSQFKYLEIEQEVMSYLSLPTGSKLPTMRTLSKQMDVSMVTLRRAIGNLEKRGLLVSRQGSGVYVGSPNRDLVFETEILPSIPGRQTIYIVDVFLKGEYAQKLTNSFVLGKTIEGARKACLRHHCGLRLLLFEYEQGIDEALSRILSSKYKQGLLIRSRSFFDAIQRHSIPWVTLGPLGDSATEFEVRPDLFEAGRLAGEHLAQLGHTNVLFVGFNPQAGKIPLDIHAGFCFGHRKTLPNGQVHEVFAPYQMGMHRQEEIFREEAKRVLSKIPEVSATFITSDGIAEVTVPYLLQHGVRIPQTTSLVTQDDSQRCLSFTPTWTSVNIGLDCVAESAVDIIAGDKKKSNTSARHIVIQPRLVVREIGRAHV